MQLRISEMFTVVSVLLLSISMSGQVNGWNPKLESDSEKAMRFVLKKAPKLETFKDEAYGYVVFPKVTKAAIGVGGAAGNGIVYKLNKVVGKAHLKQATVGIQFGGQQYVEVIFFEDRATFVKFTNGKLKFDAQASAVALKSGTSIDAAYQNGVAVFTLTKGGVMYEASLGGQHFKYTPKTDEIPF
ncbi:hypothetical protein [Flagellimonas algicola]|nr:hypothetical protein [Allomuricauda algicola]